MTHLPTLSRVFGVVDVNTSQEPLLDITITRDRLVQNQAYEDLVSMVRHAIDFYAMQRAKRVFEEKESQSPIVPLRERLEDVEKALHRYEVDIPKPIFTSLKKEVREATIAAEERRAATMAQLGLLGSLATAGMSALAYQHEFRRQLAAIDDIITRLGQVRETRKNVKGVLDEILEELAAWVDRSRSTNALFDYLSSSENIEVRSRFVAKDVLGDIKSQVLPLARGIPIQVDLIKEDLRLPKASLVEWGAIFQNIFINAFNALIDCEEPRVVVTSQVKEKRRMIVVQDTGVGVDLSDLARLFKPFERGIELSPERRQLGYGGTGLGLTIVDMIAPSIGCEVSFMKPEAPFNTAFILSWQEG